MININQVMLVGRVTYVAELKKSANSMLKFTLVTTRRYKKGDEWQKEDMSITVAAFGGLAERTAKNFAHLQKGKTVVGIVGTLTLRKWTDNNGDNRCCHEVLAEKVQVDANEAKAQTFHDNVVVPTQEEDQDIPF